jgi:hypothetical protein
VVSCDPIERPGISKDQQRFSWLMVYSVRKAARLLLVQDAGIELVREAVNFPKG